MDQGHAGRVVLGAFPPLVSLCGGVLMGSPPLPPHPGPCFDSLPPAVCFHGSGMEVPQSCSIENQVRPVRLAGRSWHPLRCC